MGHLKSVSNNEQLQIAIENKQKAFYQKDARAFNFWVSQIELINYKRTS
jgi:hypothetical protein